MQRTGATQAYKFYLVHHPTRENWRAVSTRASLATLATANVSHSRRMIADQKNAKQVRTEATAATVLVFTAAAAASVAGKRTSENVQRHQQQALARSCKRLQQSIQQHHQICCALLSCIIWQLNYRHRQQQFQLRQPLPTEDSDTNKGRVYFSKKRPLHVYVPTKPVAARSVSMCANSGCSVILVTNSTADAAKLPNTGLLNL